MTPKQLFLDYCYYRDNTINIKKLKQTVPQLRPLKYNDERATLFNELMLWCNARKLPVRKWLYSLFVTRKWMFAPKLEVNHLCSENHIPKFRRVSDYRFFDKYIAEKSENKKGVFDPNIEVTKAVEQRKRELIQKGGPKLCQQFMEDETFGFHPKSVICKFCNDWFECAKKLNKLVGFDIFQLRNGNKNG